MFSIVTLGSLMVVVVFVCLMVLTSAFGVVWLSQ